MLLEYPVRYSVFLRFKLDCLYFTGIALTSIRVQILKWRLSEGNFRRISLIEVLLP